jgi:hypothetical protein
LNRQPLDLHTGSPTTVVRAARIYSNVVSPPVVSVLLGCSIAWVDSPFWTGLMWAVLYGLLISLLPLGIVLYMLKTGRISDLHIHNRQERHIPYLITFVGSVIALIVAYVFGGSQLLRSLLVCNTVGLVFLGFINARWLISNHTATIMQATVFSGFVFGHMVSVALAPVVGLTFVARLILRRHTIAQLVAGLLVGAAPVLVLANLGYIG